RGSQRDFGHEIYAAEQQNDKGNASAPYLKVLETGEGGFYRFDDFDGIGDADGVVDEDGIGDDVGFVLVPVALKKDGIGFLTDKNGIVTENGIADKVVAVMDFHGFCRNILHRFAGGEENRQTQDDGYRDFIFHLRVSLSVQRWKLGCGCVKTNFAVYA
ncbi:MAG TPA: hypothetical protein GXZ88_08820, partial [Firmicutes bacterium]|nr:hypothetical protein [Candidatus Fermentithermobacillaceae bacterium]